MSCAGRVTRVHPSPRARAIVIYTGACVSGAIYRYIGLRRYNCATGKFVTSAAGRSPETSRQSAHQLMQLLDCTLNRVRSEVATAVCTVLPSGM